jgi:TolB protein
LEYQIYAVDVRTSEVRELGDPFAGADIVRWSPDGKRIAFDGKDGLRAGIFTMDADGNDLMFLTPDLVGSDPEWSPDGQQIAFVGANGGGLYLMDSDGANPRELIGFPDFPGTMSQIGLDWSPDGKWLVFGHSFEVWVVGVDDKLPRQLTEIQQHYQGQTWSPDSQRIAFPVYQAPDSMDIFAMSPLGGPMVNLTDSVGALKRHPAWSPDGHSMAVSMQDRGKEGISIINLEDETARRLVDTPQWARSLDWVDPTYSVEANERLVRSWGWLKRTGLQRSQTEQN